MVIIETPSAFASLKVWERYWERLAAANVGGEPTPTMEATDRYIAFLREEDASKARSGDSSSAK